MPSTSNACHLPPGREEAIMTCLPVIPPGLWDHYLARGRWPGGIEKGLETTRDCPWVPEMAQVREQAVVVRDQVLRLDAPILGCLPPGWYRYAIEPPRSVDPVETLVAYEEAQQVSVPGREGWRQDDARELETVEGCPIISVPTLDLLVPIPFRWSPVEVIGGVEMTVPPGAFGSAIVRLFGSSHPMFSTGLGVISWPADFLTELGRQYFAERPQAGGSRWIAPWQGDNPNDDLPLQAITRDYAVSHMQCLTPLRDASGRAPRWRWRFGGTKPAAFVPGRAADAFELQFGTEYSTNWPAWLAWLWNERGERMDQLAPEYPVGPGQVNGPAPGTYLTV